MHWELEKTDRLVWGMKILVLGAISFGLFFIAEHDLKMSSLENFVQDIEQQESWAAGGNSMRRIAFLGCAGLGLAGLMLGNWQQFRWNLPMVLFMLYMAWSGASVLWSIDPGATIRRYLLMVCCAMGCLGISRFLTIEQILLAFTLAALGWLGIGLSAEILLGTFRPHQGDYRFAGSLHPNLQSSNLAIMCIAAFSMSKIRPSHKWWFYGVMVLAGGFILLTKCRTVAGVLPLSLIAIWFFTQPNEKITIGSLVVVWVTGVAAFGFLLIGFDPVAEYSELLLLGRGEETGTSLTGRLPLWKELSGYIVSRPWQGFGYGAFWTPRHIYDIAIGQEWVISEAHSSYVDTTLQTGIIGAVLMFGTAVSTLVLAIVRYRRTGQSEYIFFISAVTFCLCRGFTESGLESPASFTSPIFLSMASHCWNASQQATSRTVPETTTTLFPQPGHEIAYE